MILTCPSCSAKFIISSEALGEQGREVRCGKCRHIWFQAGERDSLDELLRSAADDIDFASDPSDNFEPDATAPTEANRENFDSAQREFIGPDPDRTVSNAGPAWLRIICGISLALACAAIVVLALFLARDFLAEKSRFFATVYERMGIHVEVTKSMLGLEKLSFNQQNGAPALTGTILNLGDKAVQLHNLKIEFLTDHAVVIDTDVIEFSKEIPSEAVEKFQIPLSEVPEKARMIHIEAIR